MQCTILTHTDRREGETLVRCALYSAALYRREPAGEDGR